MLPFADVNIFAVLVAVILSTLLAMFWYSPAGFGKQWMALSGVKEGDGGSMAPGMLKEFISNIVATYALGVILLLVPADLSLALPLGATIIVATDLPGQISGVIWEKRPLGLLYINLGYTAVAMALKIVVLTQWVW